VYCDIDRRPSKLDLFKLRMHKSMSNIREKLGLKKKRRPYESNPPLSIRSMKGLAPHEQEIPHASPRVPAMIGPSAPSRDNDEISPAPLETSAMTERTSPQPDDNEITALPEIPEAPETTSGFKITYPWGREGPILRKDPEADRYLRDPQPEDNREITPFQREEESSSAPPRVPDRAPSSSYSSSTSSRRRKRGESEYNPTPPQPLGTMTTCTGGERDENEPVPGPNEIQVTDKLSQTSKEAPSTADHRRGEPSAAKTTPWEALLSYRRLP
jgi:hypothetical protein